MLVVLTLLPTLARAKANYKSRQAEEDEQCGRIDPSGEGEEGFGARAKHIKFVTELPMTGVGKVDKKSVEGKLPDRPRADGGVSAASCPGRGAAPLGGAPQSRDRLCQSKAVGPGSAAHHAVRDGVLRSVRDTGQVQV
jgi:hypothetical protein